MNELEINIDKILSIGEKYNFEYLDEYVDEKKDSLELKLEYVGDDMEYKEEDDFENIIEWREFVDEQGEVVRNHFGEMMEEMKKKGVEYIDYEYDDYDYPCVYLYFHLGMIC